MEVQRYPADFDGVIAGDPATGTPMQVGRAVVFQQLLSSPASYLPVEKVELLSASTLAACDAQGRPRRRADLRSAAVRLRSGGAAVHAAPTARRA